MNQPLLTLLLGLWLAGFILSLIYALYLTYPRKGLPLTRDRVFNQLLTKTSYWGWVPLLNLPAILVIAVLHVMRVRELRSF